jgi:transposase
LGDETERLTRRIEGAVAGHPLLALSGAGPLTAARLIAEVGDIRRFRSPDALAALAGVAPIPASSGQTQRRRLNRGGNRRLNRAFYVIAIAQARWNPIARAYIDRRIKVDGKTWREAIRALKRRLVRPVYHLLIEGSRQLQLTT